MADTDTNYWPDDECAKSFWDQHKALPYQELLDDTRNAADPQAGEEWLDLGCGGGQLTAMLWKASNGAVKRIVSMDVAPVNAQAIAKLCTKITPKPAPEQITFQVGNFSDGLPQLPDAAFDGIVSGLAISYAESRDPQTGAFTDFAYNRLLGELQRVLKPGGRLVFSINVPEPNFLWVFIKSLGGAFRISKPGRALTNAFKMMKYGNWLKREARRGRFHYFPYPEIEKRLHAAGFRNMTMRLSYAKQAYVIIARKEAVALSSAA